MDPTVITAMSDALEAIVTILVVAPIFGLAATALARWMA